MTQKHYQVLGRDIALTRYTGLASGLRLDVADSWGTLDAAVAPAPRTTLVDLAVSSGRENLAQALVLRLLTPLGALTDLGHPEYGCRLVELIGRLNNETTRNLARLFTIEALSAEPRVVEVLDLQVRTVAGQPDTIQLGFSVLPLDDDAPLALALEVNL